MELQAKKFIVDPLLPPGKNSFLSSYHHCQRKKTNTHSFQLRGRTMENYLKMYCLKSDFFKHLTE